MIDWSWRLQLTLECFQNSRPLLYHLTDRRNLARIQNSSKLIPAAILIANSGHSDLLRMRRRNHEVITIKEDVIRLRDQAPLREGNAAFLVGYTFGDFKEDLNSRVFFWPGNYDGPIPYGIRHFERYRDERPVIIRTSVESMMKANPDTEPQFCVYNSGSPRCSKGKKSPRGPDTFTPAAAFFGVPSQVVEVTFNREISLPDDSQVGSSPTGPWRRLRLECAAHWCPSRTHFPRL